MKKIRRVQDIEHEKLKLRVQLMEQEKESVPPGKI